MNYSKLIARARELKGADVRRPGESASVAELLADELEKTTNMLWGVYRQVGNGSPGFKRHALTPAIRDEIRDYLYPRPAVRLCEYRIVPATGDMVRIERRLEGGEWGPLLAEMPEPDAREWLRGLTIVEEKYATQGAAPQPIKPMGSDDA